MSAYPFDFDWQKFCEILRRADVAFDDLYDKDDPFLRLQGVRCLAMSLAHSYYTLMTVDPDRPMFHPHYSSIITAGGGNPDFTYYYCALDSSGVYRITGTRGTSRFILFATAAMLESGNLTRSPTFDGFDVDDDLTVGPDGTFDVILSAERPEGYAGDWQKLDPRATEIFARQAVCDWANEVTGVFAIERIDVPPRGREWSADYLRKMLQLLAEFPERYLPFQMRHVRELLEQGFVNKVKPTQFADAGGFPNQLYYEAIYDFSPGEALIVETEMPERAKYWSIQQTDMMWNSVDSMGCQSGLNDHQARIDTDGKMRMVVSVEDPGVPNWIDTIGQYRGILLGRWNVCSSYPLPEIRKVPFAEVRRHLPAGTPVVTPEERELHLRERRRAAQMRRKW